MGKWHRVRDLNAKKFFQIVGVSKETFEEIVCILTRAKKEQKKRGGSANRLNPRESALLCLEYLREYRTYEHLAVDYQISVATCHRVCRWVEDTLIQNPQFHLPGKKVLKQPKMQYEVVIVDATESPIQRPKKKLEMGN